MPTLTVRLGACGGAGGCGIHALRFLGGGADCGGCTGVWFAAIAWHVEPIHDVPCGHAHPSPCATEPPGQL